MPGHRGVRQEHDLPPDRGAGVVGDGGPLAGAAKGQDASRAGSAGDPIWPIGSSLFERDGTPKEGIIWLTAHTQTASLHSSPKEALAAATRLMRVRRDPVHGR